MKMVMYLQSEEDKADVLIVNTCCFIEDAKKKALRTYYKWHSKNNLEGVKHLLLQDVWHKDINQEILDENSRGGCSTWHHLI